MPDESPASAAAKDTKTFVEFLVANPPDSQLHVRKLGILGPSGVVLNEADIRLPCDNEKCQGKGDLHFARAGDRISLDSDKWKFIFITYVCRNCRQSKKCFALSVKPDSQGFSGTVLKLGETPPFGPPVPSRVISLIGPDREIFLTGRRAENHGFGIGAYAYYRRVIENQKGRIIQEMAKVAKKLNASDADLALFEAAAKETQFKKAVETIKFAIPSALLLQGHNPLLLLHEALSDGIHELSDEECLEYASEIRLILTDLAERISENLKESSELKEALSKMLARNAKKNSEKKA